MKPAQRETLDLESRLKQLWLRTLLALGIIWGAALLVLVLFTFRGEYDSTFNIFAAVLNSLTIFPA